MKRYSSLKTHKPLRAKKPWRPKRKPFLAKKSMRRIGKVGRANTASRRKISQIAEANGMDKCEIRLEGCTFTWPLAPAHRHKRAWYKGDAEKLANKKQWVVACQNCHDQIEHNAELTEEIFIKLRGGE